MTLRLWTETPQEILNLREALAEAQEVLAFVGVVARRGQELKDASVAATRALCENLTEETLQSVVDAKLKSSVAEFLETHVRLSVGAAAFEKAAGILRQPVIEALTAYVKGVENAQADLRAREREAASAFGLGETNFSSGAKLDAALAHTRKQLEKAPTAAGEKLLEIARELCG